MFKGCSSLENLDISNFDMENAERTDNMFTETNFEYLMNKDGTHIKFSALFEDKSNVGDNFGLFVHNHGQTLLEKP